LRKRDGERRGAFDGAPGFSGRFEGWAVGLDAAQAREATRWPGRMMRRQALDCVERLPNSLLIKLDRCLMANSVEGRTPFLDPEVAAFAVSLPEELRANLRHGKVLLRHWLARNLPEARPFARKQGFNPPVGRWMAERGELGALVAAHPLIRPLATAEAVQAVFGRAAESPQPAWSLLFYALWSGHHLLGVPVDLDVTEALVQARGA
jgi:asparagine synthase (glutamine-hydrolysing)